VNVVLVIPAYNPGPELEPLVREMIRIPGEFASVILVDDGSEPQRRELFDRLAALPGVTVLRHAVNLGKGTALKTALNEALCRFPESAGAVTADADGQHTPSDIRAVARMLDDGAADLILGARRFSRDIPLRSMVGNRIILTLFRLLVGRRLSDTQTGLRGIASRVIAPLLHIGHSGYEFELDMLIMSKHHGWSIAEVPIETVYIDDNRSSHFRPIRDSIHISMQLFRFVGVSLATAAIDYAIFVTCFRFAAARLPGLRRTHNRHGDPLVRDDRRSAFALRRSGRLREDALGIADLPRKFRRAARLHLHPKGTHESLTSVYWMARSDDDWPFQSSNTYDTLLSGSVNAICPGRNAPCACRSSGIRMFRCTFSFATASGRRFCPASFRAERCCRRSGSSRRNSGSTGAPS
jgi:glycosyltransferase involved in cell wall biosynthesis